MTSKYLLVAKVALTAVTLIYGIVPAIADLNETHLLNPEWSAHARLHGSWFLFFGAFMGTLSLYFIWVRDSLILPTMIGLGFVSGFWLAVLTAPLYSGALVDSNGVETQILGLDANAFIFTLLTITLLLVLVYALRRQTQSGD
ncbi:MAG: DUF6640 family protein [Pseudomonadota bacterium]